MNIVLSRVPTRPSPQIFGLSVGSAAYRLRLVYAGTEEGGWLLDIADAEDAPLVSGIPLVTGANLMGQYAYLGLGFGLYVATQGERDAVPTFANLGSAANLYIVQVQ